jgi:quercetin dioxygenase-like cupin family protein
MFAVHQSQLPFAGMSHEFVGAAQSGIAISFFLVNGEPGQGTRLHKHDYDEVVYVIEGRSKWTVSGQEREASAGEILIVHAGEPHKFINSGEGILRQIDIHLNPEFETTWLEE